MSELDTMQDYLESLRAEGEIQSRGKFTLDPQQTRVKIAEMQRHDLTGWLCWWMRSGVCLEAQSGSVQCGRDLLTARFVFGADSSGLAQVERFLRLGDDGVDNPGIELVRSTLLWTQSLLETRRTLQASLVLESPGQPLLSLRVQADEVQLQHSPTLGSEASLTLALQDRKPQRAGGGELLPLRMALWTGLPPRLAFCPIPVTLDGVLLNSGAPLDAGGDSPLVYMRYYVCPPGKNVLAVKDPRCWPARNYHLNGAMPQKFSRPRMSSPPSRVNTFSLAGELPEQARWSHSRGVPMLQWRGGHPEQLFLEGHDPLRGDGWAVQGQPPWLVRLALFRVPVGTNEWAIVHHGLRLDWETLPLTQTDQSLGWRAVVAIGGARTDISGTRALRDEACAAVEEWLRGEIVDVHRRQHADLAVAR